MLSQNLNTITDWQFAHWESQVSHIVLHLFPCDFGQLVIECGQIQEKICSLNRVLSEATDHFMCFFEDILDTEVDEQDLQNPDVLRLLDFFQTLAFGITLRSSYATAIAWDLSTRRKVDSSEVSSYTSRDLNCRERSVLASWLLAPKDRLGYYIKHVLRWSISEISEILPAVWQTDQAVQQACLRAKNRFEKNEEVLKTKDVKIPLGIWKVFDGNRSSTGSILSGIEHIRNSIKQNRYL